ncbi:hypothetical protein SOPP22_10935 [Shewanella sp. OPT22]|nr:hypothetical protein SOPP22_10935 [Shewanella sp. OPT22]
MTNTTLNLTQVIRSASYQLRAKTDESWIDELAEMLKEGEQFSGTDAPTVALHNNKYWLTDGFHRTAAATQAGHEEMEFHVVEVESEYDILLMAIKANGKHGKRNSSEDYKSMVEALMVSEHADTFMKHKFAIDTRKLAETIGCSTRHVQKATATLRESLQVDMDTFVLDRRAEGVSNNAISKEIGCNSTTVDRLVTELKQDTSAKRNSSEMQNTQLDTSAKRNSSEMQNTETINTIPSQHHDSPADAFLADNEDDFSLIDDELHDTFDDVPFDINSTDAVKLTSAKDLGDEVDPKDKQAVEMESQHEAIEYMFNNMSKFTTNVLTSFIMQAQAELKQRTN